MNTLDTQIAAPFETAHKLVAFDNRGTHEVLCGESCVIPSDTPCNVILSTKALGKRFGTPRFLISVQYEGRDWFAWCDAGMISTR